MFETVMRSGFGAAPGARHPGPSSKGTKMKTYHDPFALSLALFRLSGYAVATQMRCANVLARGAMDFATFRPWRTGVAASLQEPAPQPPAKPARKPAARRKPASAKTPAAPARLRLVDSTDAPAKPAAGKARRQPSAPPSMPERAATGTDAEA
ncbi:MAG: hypothetical protein ACLFRZ_13005 [Rhodosalinus sp.]|uniref:hypothetical protein n=1 Tax=Rhodosalinus sp. TaxID=2047741 RepID=UPI0039787BDC